MNAEDGTYRFDENGIAKCQTWYTEDQARYYFGADCRALTGMREAEKKIYVFDCMGREDCTDHLTVMYTAEDGELVPMDMTGRILTVFWKLFGGRK